MVLSNCNICWDIILLFCVSSSILFICNVSVVGMLTYKSFMSKVTSLWFVFNLNCFSSCARVVEFLVLYWYGSVMCSLSVSVRNLASLWAGAFMLLTTVRIGVPSLCSFICAFKFGARGLFYERNLACFLLMIM